MQTVLDLCPEVDTIPEGVRVVFEDTQADFQQDSIRKIEELDLSLMKVKLQLPMEKGGKAMTEEQVELAELWYKRFLKLHAMTREKLAPPMRLVDQIWHAHLLDTPKYHADCMNIFGRYFHHVPDYGPMRQEEDGLGMKDAVKKTLRLMKEHFGESPVLEADVSHCNGCCSNDS